MSIIYSGFEVYSSDFSRGCCKINVAGQSVRRVCVWLRGEYEIEQGIRCMHNGATK